MSRTAFGGAIALALGMSGVLAAQGAQSTQQQPTTQQQSQMSAQTVKVEGCLVREQAVPGREPNVAERAGMGEDFILTSVKFLEGGPKGHSATGTAGATGTSGTAGAAASAKADHKLEVRGLDEDKLQPLLNQRVEIEGRIDPSDFAERAREKASPSGEASGDLPEINGTTIRKSSSNEPCPPASGR